MTTLERLTNSLSRLPGLGRKSASRIVYYLLKSDRAISDALARDIHLLKEQVTMCRVCGHFTEEQPCSICADTGRNRSLLCVVEEPKDVISIEQTREYQGLYHVLMGVISPIDGIGPEDLRISQLMSRIGNGAIEEVILATNPTVEGDTTALYLSDLLRKESGITISRLALGLPVGGDLEYADRLTLARAFSGRNEL